jgi:hypothetical protein
MQKHDIYIVIVIFFIGLVILSGGIKMIFSY